MDGAEANAGLGHLKLYEGVWSGKNIFLISTKTID